MHLGSLLAGKYIELRHVLIHRPARTFELRAADSFSKNWAHCPGREIITQDHQNRILSTLANDHVASRRHAYVSRDRVHMQDHILRGSLRRIQIRQLAPQFYLLPEIRGGLTLAVKARHTDGRQHYCAAGAGEDSAARHRAGSQAPFPYRQYRPVRKLIRYQCGKVEPPTKPPTPQEGNKTQNRE